MLSTQDLIEIRQLIELYGHVLDEREFSRVGELFTEDALFDVADFGAGVHRGAAAIGALWAAPESKHPLGHHATNLVITEEVEGRARVASKGMGVRPDGTVSSVLYRDVLLHTPAGWRIAERIATAKRRADAGPRARRDREGNLMLPARTIPIPRSISPLAQQALAASKISPPSRWPAGDDKAGWRSLVLEHEADLAKLFEGLPPFPGAVAKRAVGEAQTFELTPHAFAPQRRDCAILYVHGGGFFMGGGELAAKAAQPLAMLMQTKVSAIDYRMPPDHPYPAALDDVVASYRDLLTRHAHSRVVVVGVSAGGGLAAAGLLKARDIGLPLPAAVVLLTPEVDLTESGDTFETNQDIDVILVRRLSESIELYADGHDLRDPYLSPLFGDFGQGFPRTLLVSGTRDLFLSNTVRMHRALRRAGIATDLHVFEAMPHGGFFGAPEDAESAEEQRRFIDEALAAG